jgi:hypothetical protein
MPLLLSGHVQPMVCWKFGVALRLPTTEEAVGGRDLPFVQNKHATSYWSTASTRDRVQRGPELVNAAPACVAHTAYPGGNVYLG